MNNEIFVVGYPKSGNTWLARLLGDTLDSPVKRWNTAAPLAEEGAGRPGKYVIYQLHLHPVYREGQFVHDAWGFNIPNASGERIVLIQRNPLDVIVSAYHYWEMSSLDEAVGAVMRGGTCLANMGGWQEFYDMWDFVVHHRSEAGNTLLLSKIHYEAMLENAEIALTKTLNEIQIDFDPHRLTRAVERQSFAVRKAELSNSGDKYNYGQTIQSKNLRHGVSGDGVRSLSPEQIGRVRQRISGGARERYGI